MTSSADVAAGVESRRRPEISVLSPGAPPYPPLLAAVADAPKRLYVAGDPGFARDPASPPAVAIVGSRNPTPYGRRMARRLAGEAARAGVAVVSGLARGIDTEAHRAALEAGGVTWAVLGSGVDRPYPPENAGLAREIVAAGGAVLSEVRLGGPPAAENFPRRNRIISGLAWAVVVVEGKATSGALITAKTALDQGRQVFAVPGPAESVLSAGPHLLLRQGAALAESFADVLEGARELRAAGAPAENGPGAEDSARSTIAEEEKILEFMGSEAVAFERLLEAMGMRVEELTRLLVAMEARGLIEACAGQRYARL